MPARLNIRTPECKQRRPELFATVADVASREAVKERHFSRAVKTISPEVAAPWCAPSTSSALGIFGKLAKMNAMTATVTGSMIQREIGDDGICVLTFDRPESGANIFDAPR